MDLIGIWHIVLATGLSVIAFRIGIYINGKVRSPLLNPLLIAILIVVGVLVLFGIPFADYTDGAGAISFFLGPATAVLAYSIYRQLKVLKDNFLPVFIGCLVGSITSMTSAVLLCKLFGLDNSIALSMVPKSVTTPIAMAISNELGGTMAVTVTVVIATGIMGAVVSPLLVQLLHLKNPVAAGVAIGTCSHAVGTTKAIEMGELEGAMAGVAIGVAGLLTVGIVLIGSIVLGIS